MLLAFSFVYLLDQDHISTPAVTTPTISATCSKCGTIKKSGKTSCCGRGGSWFRNCGSGGNSNLGYTWSEGIRACKTKARSKAGIDQRLHLVQQLDTSTGAGVAHHTSKVVTVETDWIQQGVLYLRDVCEVIIAFTPRLHTLVENILNL